MGAAYQSQAVSGYNASPPPDDSTTVAANKITWNSTIKAKLSDPLNTFIAAVNSQLVTWSDFSSVTTSTNLTTNATHHMQSIQVTSGSPTISLGDAATMTKNYIVTVTNEGTGAPIIALATGANTLDGTAAGTFTFPTGKKTSVTFKVNNGATGYDTEKVGGKDVFAYGSVFTPVIDSGTTGSLSFKTNNGSTQATLSNSGVLEIAGNLSILGTNIGTSAGQAALTIFTGQLGNNAVQQFQVLHTASATRNITVTGSNGGNPTISTTAGNLAFGAAIAGASGTVNLAGASSGSGTGIAFPASQSASADVNTLDDYEEGTWVPSLGGTATYTSQVGVYTKVGRAVHISGGITVNAIGSGSATQISGLPFSPLSATSYIFACGNVASSATSVVSLEGRSTGAGGTVIVLFSRTAASASEANNSIFQNGTTVEFSGTYFTT